MNNTTINGSNISATDPDADSIALVNYLNKTISEYTLGFIWLMGNIGSILTCIVFYQPAFRKSPCAMYFIASAFSQFFTFNFALMTRMLQYGYSDPTINTVLWFCKFRFYLFYIFVAVPRYNIIFASIDRYFASSRDALRRQWSSPKIALRLIIGNAMIWCLIYIQVLIFYEIRNGTCQYRIGAYGIFFSIYISIDSGILPLSLMTTFGLLTVRNVHKTKVRVDTTADNSGGRPNQAGKMSKKDAQLHKMLANQICLFVILNLPNPCFLLYQSFTINTYKSTLRLRTETWISNMTYVLVYLGFGLTCVNFIISSEMFRRELRNFILTKILRRSPHRVVTDGGTTARAGPATNATN